MSLDDCVGGIEMKGSEIKKTLQEGYNGYKRGFISDLICAVELILDELKDKDVVSSDLVEQLEKHRKKFPNGTEKQYELWDGWTNKDLLEKRLELLHDIRDWHKELERLLEANK